VLQSDKTDILLAAIPNLTALGVISTSLSMMEPVRCPNCVESVGFLLAQELHHRFGSGTDLKFFVDVMAVLANGFDVHTQHVGDFLVG